MISAPYFGFKTSLSSCFHGNKGFKCRPLAAGKETAAGAEATPPRDVRGAWLQSVLNLRQKSSAEQERPAAGLPGSGSDPEGFIWRRFGSASRPPQDKTAAEQFLRLPVRIPEDQTEPAAAFPAGGESEPIRTRTSAFCLLGQEQEAEMFHTLN